MPTGHNLWQLYYRKNINQLTHFKVVITPKTYESSYHVYIIKAGDKLAEVQLNQLTLFLIF